jgi:hypothetical protein
MKRLFLFIALHALLATAAMSQTERRLYVAEDYGFENLKYPVPDPIKEFAQIRFAANYI